jgi:hypothetical protein
LVGLVNTMVTTSPRENPGTNGGGLDALADSTPGQHAAAPTTLPSCTRAPGYDGQLRHEAAEGAADEALNLPGAHGVQEVCPGSL